MSKKLVMYNEIRILEADQSMMNEEITLKPILLVIE